MSSVTGGTEVEKGVAVEALTLDEFLGGTA
jgi:hypothetical protein